jgi:hypothetical protein
MTSAQKINPSRWFYLIGIIVLIIGPAVSSMLLFSTIFSTIDTLKDIPSTRVIVPGRNDISLSEAGKYTIFYEYRSILGNSVYSTGEDIPGIQVNLMSKDTGIKILLSTPTMSSSYTIGGRSGVSLFDFTIDRRGTYEIAASYPSSIQGPHIVLAVFHASSIDKMFADIMGTALKGFALVFIPFAAGVAIIIVTFLKRRKAKKLLP